MELRVLRYFLEVAREGSITNAAEILHITQPTLSRQLMNLEEELKVQLFIRGKRSITLTSEGMLLRRRAQELIELADITENEISSSNDMICGEIFIGSGETNIFHEIADVMSTFQKNNPNVKYNLFSGNADDIKEKIDKGLIDVGILMEPVNVEKYDFIRMKDKERWGVLLPAGCELAKKEYITAEDLRGKSIISAKRSIVQSELANWFGEIYKDLNITATYNLIFNAAIMVEEGIGYALALENLVRLNENKICFKSLFPTLETGVVIVWKKGQVFSKAATRFIEKLRNAFEA